MGRRGPRKKEGKREPGGRLSRRNVDVVARVLETVDREDRENLQVGIEARIRVHGVNPAHSRDQMSGTFVGRLCIQKVISRAQYDASQTWLEERDQYLRAIAAPRQPGAIDLNRVQGKPTAQENTGKAKAAISRYTASTKAVQAKQNELRLQAHLFGALDTILVRDVGIESMVGDLRVALNALVRHYGLVGRAAVG